MNKTKIIVPAAGLSSRFFGMRPKYLLYDYKNELMLKNAINPYLKNNEVIIGILKEHNEEYKAEKFLRHEFGDLLRIVILENRTEGPADTVYQILRGSLIDDETPILIKDCDSFFEHDITDGNYICVSNISENEILKKLSSKSFVTKNEQGIITNIIEKSVVSDTFCVGGYKFNKAKLFMNAFEKNKKINEIFVSDIIQQCLIDGEIFTEKKVKKYIDVGTSNDWFEYNDKSVIFCDIDGTLVKARPKYDYESYEPLKENVNSILQKQQQGCQIIFVTARPESSRDYTENMLQELGFNNFTLIMGLQNCKRIIINDFNTANPFPRAEAINIERNCDNLKCFLK
jgi:hypothetical protein